MKLVRWSPLFLGLAALGVALVFATPESAQPVQEQRPGAALLAEREAADVVAVPEKVSESKAAPAPSEAPALTEREILDTVAQAVGKFGQLKRYGYCYTIRAEQDGVLLSYTTVQGRMDAEGVSAGRIITQSGAAAQEFEVVTHGANMIARRPDETAWQLWRNEGVQAEELAAMLAELPRQLSELDLGGDVRSLGARDVDGDATRAFQIGSLEEGASGSVLRCYVDRDGYPRQIVSEAQAETGLKMVVEMKLFEFGLKGAEPSLTYEARELLGLK